MGTIFRRIGGRIIPIKIGSKKFERGFTSSTRMIHAVTNVPTKQKIFAGSMHVRSPWHGNRVTVENVQVQPAFRGLGISSAMFDHVAKLFGRAGKKIIRTNSLEHPAQVHIRSKYKSAFIGHGFGKHGEESRKLSPAGAINAIKNMSGKVHVQATTLIPRKFRRR